ncbi:TetR/AcrR family transcriptional regulator [Aquimarina algiphila]|uniref:TetR/AcrR family transcriptional regulator n=1 Tax=Aquimarina algiphila TaxID=2047982 RepID=UPI00232FB4D8|nr:TetR/AcrR family transcriptional regulator [Aquimarina algiphila]
MSKKDIILISALQLLAEKGVHNTPMSAIAKAAGTGMGTIYNYFPNKDILINEIYVDIKQKEKAVYLSFDQNQPIKTQFEGYFTSIIDFFIENPIYFLFMEQLQASPIITEESKKKGLISVDPVVQLLIKGKQERVIKDIEINELFLFIGGAVLSYLRWYFLQKDTTEISCLNQTKMVWDAIKE